MVKDESRELLRGVVLAGLEPVHRNAELGGELPEGLGAWLPLVAFDAADVGVRDPSLAISRWVRRSSARRIRIRRRRFRPIELEIAGGARDQGRRDKSDDRAPRLAKSSWPPT